jgi:hypothetical protein
MDIGEEYKDMALNIPNHIAATYKFFQLFHICLTTTNQEFPKGIHWSTDAHDDELPDELLISLRDFLKQTRSLLKSQPDDMTPAKCKRRMWFWVQKLLEAGAFDRSVRREIILWMDVCSS